MKNFFKNTNRGQELLIHIEGMHCPSCAIALDFAIEEEMGIYSAKTNFAKSTIKIYYNPVKFDKTRIINIIEKQGYRILD